MSQLILQPFRRFIYVIGHSITLPLLHLRQSLFSSPSVASPWSQFILQPFFRFSYVTSSSLNSPGKLPMRPGLFNEFSHWAMDHCCGLGVALLLLTQRARVQSPVGPVSWLRFFLGFSSNLKTNIRKFGPHLSAVIIWPLCHPNHISSLYGWRWAVTIAVVHDCC